MAAFTPTGVEFVARNFSGYLGDLKEADKAQQKLGKSGEAVTGKFAKLGKGIVGFGATLATVAVGGVALFSSAVAGIGVASVNTAISFESAFAGVIKTTDGLTDSTGRLNAVGQELRQGFVDLSKEVPTTFEELAAIGELGGQLGIGKDALIDFTETIAALGVSTNLTEEEAATALARISNIFAVETEGMGENIGRLGSTIVDLGNNFATTERDITNFGERLAGAGAIAGLSQADILGIGTALSSVGVEAEAGGTATQKVLLAINNAVNATAEGFVDNTKAIEKNEDRLRKLNAESARLEAQLPGVQDELLAQFDAFIAAGGSAAEFGRQLGDKARQKSFETALAIRELTGETELLREQQGLPIDAGQLETFARVAGLSADEFKAAWQEDAAGAFEMFVEGLGAEGDNAANILDELGLADQRLIRAFLSLAGAGDLLERTLQTANQAWDENTALTEEAEKRYATTEAQIQIFKNSIRALGDTIGTRLLPFVNRLIAAGIAFADQFAEPIANAMDTIVVPAIESGIATIEGIFAEGGFQALGTFAMSAIEQAPEQLNQLVLAIVQFINESFPVIQEALAEWGNQFFETVIAPAIANIPATMGMIVTALTDFISNQVAPLQESATVWGEAIFEWVNDVVNNIATILGTLIVAIGAWVASDEGQGQLQEFGKSLGDFIATGLANSLGNAENSVAILGKFVAVLAGAVAGVLGLIIAIGAQITAGILEGLLEALTGREFEAATINEMGKVFEGIAANIVTIFEVLGDILSGIGDNLGIIFSTIWQNIVDTFKDILGISSPSKVFRDFGQDLIQGMIDGILSLASSLTGTITGLAGDVVGAGTSLISGIFGGGDEEGPSLDTSALMFDTVPLQEGLATIQVALNNINSAIVTMFTVNLISLQEIFAIVIQAINEQLALVFSAIFNIDTALLTMTTVTLPNLEAQTITTAEQMTIQFNAVNAVLNITIGLLNTIIERMAALAIAATSAAKTIDKKFEKANERLEESIPIVERLAKAFSKLADAARRAAAAAREASRASAGAGVTAGSGLGFQQGTLGFTVPPGFPNDTFPIGLTSREEIVVAPPGQSVENLLIDRLLNQGSGAPVVSGPLVQINNPIINNGMDVETLGSFVERRVATAIGR